MVIFSLLIEINMKMIKEKIFNIFKSAEESELLTIWMKNHTGRYSGDALGLKSWGRNVLNALGVEDDSTLYEILSGDFDIYLLYSLVNWNDFCSIFPVGPEIRDIWHEKSADRSFNDFKLWLTKSGISNVSDIVPKIGALKIVKPAESVIEGASPIEAAKPAVNNSKPNKTMQLAEPSLDIEFYKAVLTGIGAPITNNNLLYLYAWRQSEGGSAAFNPFNTTQKALGATNYNKVGVKNYTSAEQGISATVKTLLNERYSVIISSLKADAEPSQTAEALAASRWGTGELAKEVISGYESGAKPKPPPIDQTTNGIA
jgi:hypothetical protein